MTALAVAVALVSGRYFLGPPSAGHFREHFPLLEAHIAGGAVALIIGPAQFSDRLLRWSSSFHRWLGRVYLSAVCVGSLAGFGLAFFSMGGWPAHLGFGVLAILWFGTGFVAYQSAREGHIFTHQRWTVRNYALTFAAVTLRLELLLLMFGMHISFSSSYIAVSWLCWVPNLAVAEFIVPRRRKPIVHRLTVVD